MTYTLCPLCSSIFQHTMLINLTYQSFLMDTTTLSWHPCIHLKILKSLSELSLRDSEPSILPMHKPKRRFGLGRELSRQLVVVERSIKSLILTDFCTNTSYLGIRNPPSPDAYFPSMSPNDILVIATHLRQRQTNESSIEAYNSVISFIIDYNIEFYRSGVDFFHLLEQTTFW